MKKLSAFLILFLSVLNLNAQDSLQLKTSSIPVAAETRQIQTDSATVSSVPDTAYQALPHHYLFTQRLLWGENGLMRKYGNFKLTVAGREREMEIREKMNQLHQLTGFVALAGMIGSGITGQMIYNGNKSAKGAHSFVTGLTNVSYFSSLGFALFSPPPMTDRTGGFTKLKAHKILSIVHLSSMIATNVLSGMIEHNSSLKPYHRAAAMTAFTSLLLATAVIKL